MRLIQQRYRWTHAVLGAVVVCGLALPWAMADDPRPASAAAQQPTSNDEVLPLGKICDVVVEQGANQVTLTGELKQVNAHWLVPNAVAAAWVKRAPLVVSLHGSDVYMAERPLYRRAAAWALRATDGLTGSSQDLVDRALAVGSVRNSRSEKPSSSPVRTARNETFCEWRAV